MGNTRIGNTPCPQTQSATIDTAAGATSASSTSSPTKPVTTEVDPQSRSRQTGALKQHANEVKSQQDMHAKLLKRGLEKQVGKASDHTITLEGNAGNDKLAQIHVQRQVETHLPQVIMALERHGNSKVPDLVPARTDPGKEVATTRFPNGVGFKTTSAIEPNGEHIPHAVSVEPPPGGKVIATSENSSVILDASGKEVGRLTTEFDKNGDFKATLKVHTKEGEYVQNIGGQITFTPKTHGK